MAHCCPREFWACFAMWMAHKARIPDPETLLFYFLGTWRYSGETWEILECIMGCTSRKRTKQENSWYRMMYLPWQGNVRSKAKKVKEEDLKLPYWKPNVLRENTGFYIHLKENDCFLWFPGKYYQLEGATVIRAEVQPLLYSSTYTTMRYVVLQDVLQTRNSLIAILYQAGLSRPWQTSILSKERGKLISSSNQRKCSIFNGVFDTVTEKQNTNKK